MLTGFLLVQLAVNAALVCGLILVVRERTSAARLAVEREARLEGLARELCGLGRELMRAGDRRPSPAALGTEAPPPLLPRPETTARLDPTPASRILGATALLERGEAVECVAARTALSEGEVQILRNLRRRPADSPLRPTPLQSKADPGQARSREMTAATAGVRRRRGRNEGTATVVRAC